MYWKKPRLNKKKKTKFKKNCPLSWFANAISTIFRSKSILFIVGRLKLNKQLLLAHILRPFLSLCIVDHLVSTQLQLNYYFLRLVYYLKSWKEQNKTHLHQIFHEYVSVFSLRPCNYIQPYFYLDNPTASIGFTSLQVSAALAAIF